jgi:hypothetical protein
MTKKNSTSVCVRIRPLSNDEIQRGDEALEIQLTDGKGKDKATKIVCLTTPKTENDDIEHVEALGFKVLKNKPSKQKTYRGFNTIAKDDSTNVTVFQENVLPLVTETTAGNTSCVFAYGHTGSGKSHTILGYDGEPGLYRLAAERLFEDMQKIQSVHEDDNDNTDTNIEEKKDNAEDNSCHSVMMQVRFSEIYNGDAYDLLNERAKCFIREGEDGKVQIRKATESDGAGTVKAAPSTTAIAKSLSDLLEIVKTGIQARTTGNSDVHSQSSRSHAILELEIVSPQYLSLEADVIQKQTALTKVGYDKDCLEAAIFARQHTKDGDKGNWIPREDADAQGETPEEERQILEWKDELRTRHASLALAKKLVQGASQSSGLSCLGGAMVFVDLAGSELSGTAAAKEDDSGEIAQRTPQEQRECREINKSLSALHGCFHALSKGLSGRAVFRQSKLTLLLRNHLSVKSKNLMIATISPSAHHLNRTIHTLRYAQTVAQS